MNTSLFALSALSALFIATGSVSADQVVKTLPGGDGKEILENPKNPGDQRMPEMGAKGTLVVDTECAKKPKADYEKCLAKKLEQAKKKTAH